MQSIANGVIFAPSPRALDDFDQYLDKPLMERCAVIIGVDRTGDLPPLTGASSGAKKFNEWAIGQGIHTSLLVDEGATNVTLRAIKAAVAEFVNHRIYEQIIIFFAGHGILPAPNTEMWLLTGAPEDPNEAVDVTGSIDFARDSRIRNVVIISDACRSRTVAPRLASVRGGAIFSNLGVAPPRSEVDVFYAAMPGSPAMEAADPNDAVRSYKGIFTECLLRGLRNEVPSLIYDQRPHNPRWVINARKLKPYLETVVPNELAKVTIRLSQNPEVRTESDPPFYLADVPASQGLANEALNVPNPQIGTSKQWEVRTMDAGSIHLNFGSSTWTRVTKTDPKSVAAEEHTIRLLQTKGRESFETRTGFTVVGAKVRRIAITGTKHEVFFDKGATQIRVYEGNTKELPHTAILQLEEGIGIPLAVLYGMIGTVVVEEGTVIAVSYRPSLNGPKFFQNEFFEDELDRRRTFAAVAAQNGSFRIEGSKEARAAAGFLRSLKSIDPTLGLYAAYAYAQIGDIDGIQSIFGYMSSEEEPVLYDVALLARKLPIKGMEASVGVHGSAALVRRGFRWVAPFCPMLTQGWSFVRSLKVEMPEIVDWASKQLVPGLWTTFNPNAAEALIDEIEKDSPL
jgi:hypothetical protein